MSKIFIRKNGRVVVAVMRFFVGIAYIISGWLIITIILHFTCSNEVCQVWASWGGTMYGIIACIILLKNTYHRFKWYVSSTPVNAACPKCHAVLPFMRYGENRWLNAPVVLYVNFGTFRYRWTQQLLPIYMILYRPYLQLDCPECGEKQVICPYCHEPIPIEQVECHYDKVSVCPHCGKKIYTPLPLQDWEEELIKVAHISD